VSDADRQTNSTEHNRTEKPNRQADSETQTDCQTPQIQTATHLKPTNDTDVTREKQREPNDRYF